MARKLTLLVGIGVGYVLGARSGRQRYDQLKAKAEQLWRDPRVQEKADQAQEMVKTKLSGTSGGNHSSAHDSTSDPTSTARPRPLP